MDNDIRQAADGTFYVLGEPFGGYESIIAEDFETYEEGCAGRSKIRPRGGGTLGHCGARWLTPWRSKNREKGNPYGQPGGPMISVRGH